MTNVEIGGLAGLIWSNVQESVKRRLLRIEGDISGEDFSSGVAGIIVEFMAVAVAMDDEHKLAFLAALEEGSEASRRMIKTASEWAVEINRVPIAWEDGN